jgi:hypothetical protein
MHLLESLLNPSSIEVPVIHISGQRPAALPFIATGARYDFATQISEVENVGQRGYTSLNE